METSLAKRLGMKSSAIARTIEPMARQTALTRMNSASCSSNASRHLFLSRNVTSLLRKKLLIAATEQLTTLANSGGRYASSTRMKKMTTSMAVLDEPTKANVAGATRRAGIRNFAIAAFFRFWRQVKKLRCADYTNFCQQTRLCWTRLDV